jgi:hypothetical protein
MIKHNDGKFVLHKGGSYFKVNISLKFVILMAYCALLPNFVGCGYKDIYTEILSRQTSEWSFEDCRLLIAHSTKHNFQSESKVIVIVTPFTPLVVTALAKQQQMTKQLTTAEYFSYADELAYSTIGMFIDWQKNLYVDKRGNYYKKDIKQLDSLLFLITLKNITYPCISPLVIRYYGSSGEQSYGSIEPLFGNDMSLWPCYFPDITDLERRIFLINDSNDTLKPEFVWGRKDPMLNKEEVLFVMFKFRDGDKHFLQNSKQFYLRIVGFESEIELPFEVSELE